LHRVQRQQPKNRLARLRREKGIPLSAVAEAAGRDVSTVSRYERDEVPIPDDVKLRLAEYFGVSRAYLMGWDEPVQAGASS
jgi:transcriptional regulator with XRE-family HTH domain